MTTFLRHRLWPAFALLVAHDVITGVVYPAVVTAIAQVAFPRQANGSMIVVDGRTVGSSLIGQASPDRSTSGAGRPPPGDEATRLRRQRLGRLEPRADEPGPDRPHHAPRSTACGRRTATARSRSTS